MEAAATVHGKGNHLTVSHGDDTSLFVQFYFNKVNEKDFVRIRYPGDTKTELDRPVNDVDKRRFSQQWDLYQKQLSQHGADTLLKDAPFLKPGELHALERFQIDTVKQLAALSDAFLMSIGPGARDMQARAKRFMVMEEQEAREQALMQQNRAQNNRIALLETQIAELMKAMEGGEEPKKRGRKPKVTTDDDTSDSPASE